MEKIHWYEPRDNLFTKVEIYMVHSGHTERRGNLFPYHTSFTDVLRINFKRPLKLNSVVVSYRKNIWCVDKILFIQFHGTVDLPLSWPHCVSTQALYTKKYRHVIFRSVCG